MYIDRCIDSVTMALSAFQEADSTYLRTTRLRRVAVNCCQLLLKLTQQSPSKALPYFIPIPDGCPSNVKALGQSTDLLLRHILENRGTSEAIEKDMGRYSAKAPNELLRVQQSLQTLSQAQ